MNFNESFDTYCGYELDLRHSQDVDINMVNIPTSTYQAQMDTPNSTQQTITNQTSNITYYFSSSENDTEVLKPNFKSSDNSKSESFIFKFQESSKVSMKDETMQQNDLINNSEFTFNKKSMTDNLNSNYTFLNSKYSDFENSSNPFQFNEKAKEINTKILSCFGSPKSLSNSEVISSVVFDDKYSLHNTYGKISPAKVKEMFEKNLNLIRKSENNTDIIYEDSREDMESSTFNWKPHNLSFTRKSASLNHDHSNSESTKNRQNSTKNNKFSKKPNVSNSSSHRRACSLNYKQEHISINININTRSEETSIIRDADEFSFSSESGDRRSNVFETKEQSFKSSSKNHTRKGRYDDSMKDSRRSLKSRQATTTVNSSNPGCSFFGYNFFSKWVMPCMPFKK